MLVLNLIVGLLGLLVGSFLNVVIFRIPRGESIVVPGSHCPACGQALRFWELIPLISFLIQRGKCSSCQSSISWRYPLVEVLTGLLFVLTVTSSSGFAANHFRLLSNLIFVAVLVALAFIDLDTYRLPDGLTLPLLGLGLLAAFLGPGSPNGWESLLSALGAGGLFWLIAHIYPQGMGLGDVKLVAALGAFLGFPAIFLTIFIASFVGVLAGVFLLLIGGKSLGRQIPFGPSLALGALTILFWGSRILDWYWAWPR